MKDGRLTLTAFRRLKTPEKKAAVQTAETLWEELKKVVWEEE